MTAYFRLKAMSAMCFSSVATVAQANRPVRSDHLNLTVAIADRVAANASAATGIVITLATKKKRAIGLMETVPSVQHIMT